MLRSKLIIETGTYRGADGHRVQLSHHRIFYLLNADCSGRVSIIPSLIEKLCQKGRDNLFLQPVPVYFPGTRTVENGNAPYAASKRQVHGQTIAGNEAAMPLHIGQMLKQGGSALQDVYLEALRLQLLLQLVIMGPLFHGPYWTGGG